MGKNFSLHQTGIYLAVCLLLLSACAAPLTGQLKSEEPEAPVIELMNISPSPEKTVVEIINSRPALFTAFKFIDPPRVVLDIRGVPGENLPRASVINDGNVKEIRFEEGKTQTMTTRMVVTLARAVDHEVSGWNNVITLTLTPKRVTPITAQPPEAQIAEGPQEKVEKAEWTPKEPRIFFKPGPVSQNQILGVDFTLLDKGKSRLTVTTDKKVRYHLEREGPKRCQLIVEEATIPSLLMRRLDSRYFEGVLDRVKASYSSADKRVSFAISLREMVPFHVRQTDKTIIMEFGPTSIRPPEKKISPMKLTETPLVAKTPAPEQALAETAAPEQASAENHAPKQNKEIPGLKKKYTGTPMTMDFVNADVTNILRLIGEVSNLNIVWGPQVTGTVSMRLRNVPWDQALDIVLANNKLAQRRVGNVIWITTKTEMAQIEAEERQREKEIQDAEAERRKEEEEVVKKEPLQTKYITINYKDVNNIKDILDEYKGDEGKLTADTATKTIIYRDTASKIKEAEALVKRLDRPVPQVMIEARIVKADITFSRSLGIDWDYNMQRRNNKMVPWTGTPVWATQNADADYPTGGNLYNPTFATNEPALWTSTLGLLFSKLGSFGLSGTRIEAEIAFAESEGRVDTISAPKIVTRDTVTATISEGTQIVIPSGTDANGNATYQQVDASLMLSVTPTITPNNMVIMNVDVSDNSPDYSQARADQIPIKTKQVTTTMMVKSGETVVIGGIYTETKTRNVEWIPGLSKIPLLGWLFKMEATKDEKVETLIFLTPNVLPQVL